MSLAPILPESNLIPMSCNRTQLGGRFSGSVAAIVFLTPLSPGTIVAGRYMWASGSSSSTGVFLGMAVVLASLAFRFLVDIGKFFREVTA